MLTYQDKAVQEHEHRGRRRNRVNACFSQLDPYIGQAVQNLALGEGRWNESRRAWKCKFSFEKLHIEFVQSKLTSVQNMYILVR